MHISVPADSVLVEMLSRYSALRDRVLDGDATGAERDDYLGLSVAIADDLLSAYRGASNGANG